MVPAFLGWIAAGLISAAAAALGYRYYRLRQRYQQLQDSFEASQRHSDDLVAWLDQPSVNTETHYQALINALPDLIMRLNRQGYFLEFLASPNFHVLGNLPDWLNTHVSDMMPADLAQQRLEAIAKALDTNTIQIYEHTLLVKGKFQSEEVRVVPYSQDEVLMLVRDISDRKLSEQALAQSEQQNRAILQAIPDLMFRVTAEGRYIDFISPYRSFSLFNHHKDVTGRHLTEVLPSDLAQRHLFHLRRAIETDQMQHYEQQLQIDGRIQFEEVRVICSGVDEALFIIRDISDRKRAEIALFESQQRLENIAANIPGTLIKYALYTDGSEAILYASPGCQTVWEVDADRICEDMQILRNMIHPDDIAALQDSVEQSAKTLQPWVHQWRIITPSGKEKWLESAGRPQQDESGTILWDTLIFDISDRKRAETALARSEERLRLVTENMRDLVCLHSPAGRYLYVTPSSTLLLGYTPEEMSGQELADLLHPEDRHQAVAAILQPADVPVTYRIRRKTGEYIWLETLSKPILDPQGQVRHLQTASREVSDRVRVEAQLHYDAYHDSLTGLPNRSLLMERLAAAIKRQQTCSDSTFAILFLDLDNFKTVNDSLGHLIGDQLLLTVSQHLSRLIGPTDLAARLGGDEFVLLLEDIDGISGPITIANRILALCKRPLQLAEHEVFYSTSIGIVVNSGYRLATEVLRDADAAMYWAKRHGRGQYAIFNSAMRRQAIERLQIENYLRKAIENQELQLYYQPIVNLNTRQIEAFAALVRWQHPTRGLLNLEDFSDIAAELGIVPSLGEWLIDRVFQQLSVWQSRFSARQISVSISLKNSSLKDFLLPKLRRYLEAYGLPSNSLIMEITESVLLDNFELTHQLLTQLQDQGVYISIDDFSPKTSSLRYLQQLPVHALKIDRSFISTVAGDRRSQIVAKAVTALSHSLGLRTVAEGVETAQQLSWLKQLGCEAGQGLLFSPPLLAERATLLLEQKQPM